MFEMGDTTPDTMWEVGKNDTDRTDGNLIPAVPTRYVIVNTGKQAGLGDTKEEPRGHQTAPVVDEAHAEHAETPENPKKKRQIVN